MLHNEDRELQIELTKLQIEHERDTSKYTIFISVFISLMLATLSVYVPLGVLTKNFFYILFAFVFNSIVSIPVVWVTRRMAEREEQFKKEIQELKKKYVW